MLRQAIVSFRGRDRIFEPYGVDSEETSSDAAEVVGMGVVWGHEKDDVFRVSLPGLFFERGSSRREKSSSSAGTRRVCTLPLCGSPKCFVRCTLGASSLVRGRESFKKISSHHLKRRQRGGDDSKMSVRRMRPWWWSFQNACFGQDGSGAYGFLREAGTDATF